jgi:hypothetical protein
MSPQTGNYGIDYHPVVAQHLKNGLELAKYIKQIKGWAINPIALNASTLKVNEVIVNFNTEVIDSIKNFKGFTVLANNKIMGIKKVFTDSLVNTELHIVLIDSIAINQNVTLSYTPGNVSSKDSLKLGKIPGLAVTNSLTETKVTRTIVLNTGLSILIYFNKKILNPVSISGIIFFDNKNNILQIDSFKVFSSSIQFFIRNEILKSYTIYANLPSIISGQDGVKIALLDSFNVQNLSSIVVSVKEKKLDNGIEIFPNPVSQKILNYKILENVQGNITAELFDMQGRLILSKKLNSTSGEVNFNDCYLKTNTYVLKFTFSNKCYKKLIVL